MANLHVVGGVVCYKFSNLRVSYLSAVSELVQKLYNYQDDSAYDVKTFIAAKMRYGPAYLHPSLLNRTLQKTALI